MLRAVALCANCPDAVIVVLRNIVQAELDKVRSRKNITSLFSRALTDLAGLADAAVLAALNAIPTVTLIDFSDIIAYLTCPLTPLALGLDDTGALTSLDPRVQLRRLQNLFKAQIDKARRDFEDFLDAASTNQIIALARRYANELVRQRFDPVSFAKAILVSSTVLSVCGLTEYQAGPYQAFANEIVDFSLVGGVPANLDNNVAALVQKLVSAEAAFKAQLAAITTIG